MIYLAHTTDAQVAYVPRDTNIAGTLRFTLRSTVDLDAVVDAVVLDLKVLVKYSAVAVQLPDGCPAGEYEYTMTAGGALVSSGVLIVTSADVVHEYNKTVQYEQYTEQ